MKISELKKNERTTKFDFFRVSLLDGTYLMKINIPKAYNIWLAFKYPTTSMLNDILFLNDLGKFLLNRCNFGGTYNGDDVCKHIILRRIEK